MAFMRNGRIRSGETEEVAAFDGDESFCLTLALISYFRGLLTSFPLPLSSLSTIEGRGGIGFWVEGGMRRIVAVRNSGILSKDGVGEKPLHCLSGALDAAATVVAVVENTPFFAAFGRCLR